MFVWLVYFLLTYFTIQLIFGTIHGSHGTISTNIYLCLYYFQQNIFSFNNISGSQIDLKYTSRTSGSKPNTPSTKRENKERETQEYIRYLVVVGHFVLEKH